MSIVPKYCRVCWTRQITDYVSFAVARVPLLMISLSTAASVVPPLQGRNTNESHSELL